MEHGVARAFSLPTASPQAGARASPRTMNPCSPHLPSPSPQTLPPSQALSSLKQLDLKSPAGARLLLAVWGAYRMPGNESTYGEPVFNIITPAGTVTMMVRACLWDVG